MKPGVCVIVGLLAAAMVSTSVVASELSAVDVLQPIDIENVIRLSHVTYVTYNSGDLALLSVARTCDSNVVISDRGPMNWNAAFSAGLKVRVIYSDDASSLFGDTLRVVLDTRGMAGAEPDSDWPDTTLVAATVECIMVNAASSTSVRSVDLRIEGDQKFRTFAGILSTRRFRGGPVRREFH
jgi:hypothetical protein